MSRPNTGGSKARKPKKKEEADNNKEKVCKERKKIGKKSYEYVWMSFATRGWLSSTAINSDFILPSSWGATPSLEMACEIIATHIKLNIVGIQIHWC